MMYNGGEFLLSGDLCIDDILSLVQGNGLATDDPGNVHPGQKADDQDNVLKSRFQEGIHNDHDQKCRKAHQCIHQTHQHRIHRSSHKTADGTDDHTKGCRKHHGKEAHQKGCSSSVNTAGQIIPSHIIRTEKMRHGRSIQSLCGADGIGIYRIQKGKNGDQCQQDDRCCTYHCKFICLKTKFDIFPDIFSHVPLPPNILLCGSSDQRQHTGYLPEDFRAPREAR